MMKDAAGQSRKIVLTVVYDNNPYEEGLETAWGFACVVQGLPRTILFDTGGNGELLLSNMRKLGIKAEVIDAVVISHGHQDHYGGLEAFLGQNHDVTVYLPQSVHGGLKKAVKHSGAELLDVRQPMELCEDTYSTGELGSQIREQSLVIKTAAGPVLLTGCAHPGIVVIIHEAQKQLGEPINAALGGFHLSGASRGQITQIVEEMKAAGVQAAGPCHCSGDLARSIFREAYRDNFFPVGVGWQHRFGRTHNRVCVYSGPGTVKAPDVEFAMEKLSLDFSELDRAALTQQKLKGCGVLIMPGGQTEQILSGLGSDGLEEIREFIRNGGGYVGICSGAYLAAETVEVPGRPTGLGVMDIKNRREAGEKIRTIEVLAPEHAIFAGCTRAIDLWYQNGPAMEPGHGVEALARYEDGAFAVACCSYGKGTVVVFSPHPEGSLEARVDPEESGTIGLLNNAIRFASRATH